MHVGMIIDRERLIHEYAMLNRLSVGLIDGGVQLTRIIPDQIDVEAVHHAEERISLATRLTTPATVLPWMRRRRTATLAAQLERSVPNVFYALGEQAWPIATDLAQAIDRPAALGVWCAELVRKVPKPRPGGPIAAYIAPTRPIAEALKRRVDPDCVSQVPMGVAMPAHRRVILEHASQIISIAIIGSGRDVHAYEATLVGLSKIVHEFPQVHIVLELRGPHEHDIWRIAERLNLLGQLSTIVDASQHRALLAECDLLLLPESFGELSSSLLETMAKGVAIIAADDPYLDMLIDEETALLVGEADPEIWSRQVLRLIRDPNHARQLGAHAREFVTRHHRSTVQVNRLIDTLDRIVRGDALAFSPRDSGG